MKVKEKSIYKGHLSFSKKVDLVDYEIMEWKCQLCEEWITMVLVDGKVLLGGSTYSSDIDKKYCNKCSWIRIRIENPYSASPKKKKAK